MCIRDVTGVVAIVSILCETLCEILVAIAFGNENHIFFLLNLAKIHIFVPKCTEGGGSTGIGNIPKKNKTMFLLLPSHRDNKI